MSALNKKGIQELKARLEAMRGEISESIRNIEKNTLNKSQRDASGDLSGYSFHMADMATDNFDRELNLDIGSKEQQLLNQIENALTMIADGTYGKCEECDEPISFERLKAVPFARLCLKCQEAAEKHEKEG